VGEVVAYYWGIKLRVQEETILLQPIILWQMFRTRVVVTVASLFFTFVRRIHVSMARRALLHWISARAALPWIFGGLQANVWEMQPQMPIVVTVAIRCSSTSIGDIAQLDLTFSQRIIVFPRKKRNKSLVF
jgi:hypothetical protein